MLLLISLRPMPLIRLLTCQSGGFLVIFYFVWSGLRKKIRDLGFFFFFFGLLWTTATGGGGGVGSGCGCGCGCGGW